MDPVLGQIIVGAIVAVIVFFSGRSTLARIKAELRGEKSCAGCPGCGGAGSVGSTCCGSGKSCEECRLCMRQLELLKEKKE